MRLLDGCLAIVEECCLSVVVGEALGLASHLIGCDGFPKRREARDTSLERTPTPEGVGLVGDLAPIDALTVHAVALVVVHLRDRRVDRYFVEVRATEARDLRVLVGMDAPGEKGIIREVDAGNDVRGAIGNLLGL